jgi:hypothetical protein
VTSGGAVRRPPRPAPDAPRPRRRAPALTPSASPRPPCRPAWC